jgi:glycosyltransferase involved in cell wall biosynthesis
MPVTTPVSSPAASPCLDDAGADRVFGTTNRAAQAVLQIANVPAVSRVRALVRTWRPDLAIVPQFAYHLSPAVFGALDGVDVVAIALDYKFICPLGTKLLPDGSTCRDPHGAVCWRRGCVSALHWLRDRPRYRAMAARLRPPTRIVACSHGVQAALAREGIESECVLLPVPPASPSYRRQPAAAPLFVYVGRLAAAKGVDVLVHAFAALAREVPAARLRVIGDGPERASLTHLAASAGVGHAVTFTGTLAPPDVEQELARAWALVAPSRWEEPFGLVAVEAIVRGVPVVASARGGFAETVEDGSAAGSCRTAMSARSRRR